ncbi:MAG: hypothetical protein LUH01_07075 [Parabacteroides gordonii]|nr:hypothetical protein [Parabacteroides gordonii]
MADILCRLKLVTDNYDKNLKASRQQMQDFDKTVKFAGAGVTKFLGVLGLGVTAGEAFNRAINSSQTLSDEYNRSIDGLTGTVDNLFYSIANGDWSPFLQGLSNAISLARDAYNALDQLGNTKMSYGYFNMKNQAGLQDQIAILKDKNATAEQKALAETEAKKIIADQKEITEQLSRRSFDAMKSLVQKSTGFGDLDVSQMNLEKAFRLDASAMGDEEKAKLSAMYEEFKKRSVELQKQNSTTQTVQSGVTGFQTQTVLDQSKFKEALKPLLSEYQDAIIYNSTLVKESDEWLNNIMQIGSESFVADRTLASMVKTMNRASQSGTGTSKKKKVEKEKPVEGSIDYINAQISDLTKKLNAATDEATRYGLRKAIEKFNKEKHLIELEATIKPLESKKVGKVTGKSAKDAAGEKVSPIANKKLKSAIAPKDVKVANQYNDALDHTLSMLLAVSNATNEGAAGWIVYGANSLTALNSTYQALAAVIPALQVKALVAGAASAAETPIVGWITAIAAIGAMTAAFASLPKYETGGIVGVSGGVIPGASFSGDKILARVNSRELILNRAQQKNIASQLVSGGGASRVDVNVVGRISGRDLELVMEKRNQFKRRTQ